MSDYHEPVEELSPETRNFTRALMSLKEEVEAISWYQQRIDATADEELRNILAHNRDEEIEHACMALEWLRRNMPGWDRELRKFLFREEEVSSLEGTPPAGTGEKSAGGMPAGDLGIGKMEK